MERERVQHHGLLQREEEGRGTEDSGVAEEGGMVVETAVRGMCSLNQASPGAKTERNTSLSRGWGGAGADRLFCFHQHHQLRTGKKPACFRCRAVMACQAHQTPAENPDGYFLFDVLINARLRLPALHNHGIKGAHESKQPDIKERRAASERRRECGR